MCQPTQSSSTDTTRKKGASIVSEGAKFGKWVVVNAPKPGSPKCRAMCSLCGKSHWVWWRNLAYNKSHMCGECSLAGNRSKRLRLHGMAGSSEYMTWSRLKQEKQLCQDWQDFAIFHRDMGVRPKGLVIVRPNPMLPFGPGNGYWGDDPQCKTRPMVRKLRYGGRSMTVKQLAKALGVTRQQAWNLATEGNKCAACGVASRAHYCAQCRAARSKHQKGQ